MNTLAVLPFFWSSSSNLSFFLPLIFWLTSQFVVLEELSAWGRAGFNCAAGALQFNEGLRSWDIVVVQRVEAFQLFDPEFYQDGDFCYSTETILGEGRRWREILAWCLGEGSLSWLSPVSTRRCSASLPDLESFFLSPSRPY